MSGFFVNPYATATPPSDPAVLAYQADLTTLVSVAGYEQSAWATGGNVVGTAGGLTFILPSRAFRQNGVVRQVRVNVAGVSLAEPDWKLKIFRHNYRTATFDFVGERTFTPGVFTGLQTFDLASPIAVQQGDVPGLLLGDSNSRIYYSGTPTLATRYTTGDIITSSTFPTTGAWYIELECFSNRPYLAVTGDSIFGGNAAGADRWYPPSAPTAVVPTNPGGNPSAQPSQRVAAASLGLEQQNAAKGSQQWAWIVANGGGFDLATATDPHTVIIMAGVNDLAGGTPWATVEANLATLLTKWGASSIARLIVCGIMPWTNGSDAQAATRRAWNTDMAAWCATNGATFLPTDAAMGQIRPATGQLDDLKDAYDQDGVHLTMAGVGELGALLASAIA